MVKHGFRTSSAFKTSTIVDDTFSGHVNIFAIIEQTKIRTIKTRCKRRQAQNPVGHMSFYQNMLYWAWPLVLFLI